VQILSVVATKLLARQVGKFFFAPRFVGLTAFFAPRFVGFAAVQRSVTPEPRDKKPELQVHVDDMAFETLFAGQDVQGPPENEYMFAGQLKHCVALD